MRCVSWQGGSVPKILTLFLPPLFPLPNTSPAAPVASHDEYRLIAVLEKTPALSQRDLASTLGFSLGKVNYCLKALVDKGWIKATRFLQNPHKSEYAYLLTPQGIGSKAVLTAQFLERKMAQYEQLRAEIEALQAQMVLPQAGPAPVLVPGPSVSADDSASAKARSKASSHSKAPRTKSEGKVRLSLG